MSLPRPFLGAMALSPILGILAPLTVDTIPKQNAAEFLESIPRHDIVDYQSADGSNADLPDHYPLVTRHGRIEVDDLIMHGLYSNRRFAAAYYEMDYEGSTDSGGLTSPDLDLRTSEDFTQDATASEPLPLAAGPVTLTAPPSSDSRPVTAPQTGPLHELASASVPPMRVGNARLIKVSEGYVKN